MILDDDYDAFTLLHNYFMLYACGMLLHIFYACWLSFVLEHCNLCCKAKWL